MNAEQREEAVFEAAVKLPAAERAAYLDQTCGGDAELRHRMGILIGAFERASGFMKQPASPERTARASPLPKEKPGDRIGRCKLLEQIGEGGCGVVYVAEQEEPVRRRVALKIIKLGMDTRSVIARFEAERQALALMDHPNIAKVFDAGATETGRPYFVMELVRGLRITDYCEQNHLAPRDRLDLFIQACRAIQHAHQKGIIHRDIKPSNILVTVNDGVPVPKVIDFGIAKATQGRLTDQTVYTAFEQFIGTPAYMSPEQALMTSLDVDTRSDIYSLGVLLYELLTSTTPFDAKELLSGGLDEMRRTIREIEPVKPSTRLTQELNSKYEIRNPKSEIRKIGNWQSAIPSDLDWIVMKCLEKDRTRRYETANGLATDVRRYLNSEPVVARPPSTVYRFQKLVRRNKLVFTAVAAVLVALLLGTVVSTWQMIQTRRARTAEVKARADAEQRLYDSLLREARATRLARGIGYRDQTFALLQQARALKVPNPKLGELRREAVASLGDFVGLTPAKFAAAPANVPLCQMRLAPNGRLSAFLLGDGTILLQEVPSGKAVAMLKHQSPGRSLCFNTNGERFISVHQPWSGSEQEQLAQATLCGFERTPDGQWRMTEDIPLPGAFECLRSQDELLVAVEGAGSNQIELLEATRRTLVCRIAHQTQPQPSPLALSPDSQLLAVGEAGALQIWNPRSGQRLQRVETHLEPIFDISFSQDGQYVACLAENGCALYRTIGFEHVTTLGDLFSPFSGVLPLASSRAAFSPGGGVLVLPLYQQNRLRLWDAIKHEDLASLQMPESVFQAAFADENLLLISGANTAWVFQFGLKAEKLNLAGHNRTVTGVCFDPNGRHIASVSKDRMVKVWDVLSGRLVWQEMLPDQGQAVAYSPDGRFLVTTAAGTRRLWLWDARTGTRLLELGSQQDGTVWSAQFSPDSRYLAAASSPYSGVTIWSLDTATNASGQVRLSAQMAKFRGGAIWNLVFAPKDEQLAFMVSSDRLRQLYVWNFTANAEPRLLTEDILSQPQNLSFTPDGRQLVFMNSTRCIVSLEAASGTKVSSIPTLQGHPAPGSTIEPSLCLSPDGTRLALSSTSRRGVDIWDAKARQLLYSLPDQSGAVYWLAWSPDSQRLAVSRSDGDIAIWILPEIERVLARLGLAEQGEKP